MIKVGLFVRLEAKPGKETQVERLLKAGLSAVQEEPERSRGSQFALGRQHSASSMYSQMKPGVRRICRDELPLR